MQTIYSGKTSVNEIMKIIKVGWICRGRYRISFPDKELATHIL